MQNISHLLKKKTPTVQKGVQCFYKEKPGKYDNAKQYGTAIIMLDSLENNINFINSEFYSPQLFRNFFTDMKIRQYPEDINVPFVRNDVYSKVKNESLIMKTPKSPGLLKELNTYYFIGKEYELFKESPKNKTDRKRVENLGRFLSKKIETIASYGYQHIVLVLPLMDKNNLQFWEDLKLGWRYGFTGINSQKVELLAKFGDSDLFVTFPFVLGSEPLEVGKKNIYINLIERGIKRVLNKDIKASISGNGNYDERNDIKKYYIITNNFDGKNIINSSEEEANLDINIDDAINRFYSVESGTLQFANNANKLSGLMEANGYDLCEVESRNSVLVDEKTPAKKIKLDYNRNVPSDILEEIITEKVYSNIVSKINGLNTQNEEISKILGDLQVRIRDLVETQLKDSNSTDSIKELLDTINSDSGLINKIEEIRATQIAENKKLKDQTVATEVIKRNENAKVTVNNEEYGSVQEIIKKTNSDTNYEKKLPLDVSFDFMNKITSDSLDTTYAENFMMEDIVSLVSSFNNEDSEPPIIVKDINVEDTSDELNLLNTITINYEIPGKKPQKVVLDFPQISSDGYVYLNGTKNFILSQVLAKPIVFIRSGGKDTVQFTSNYNKMFIDRSGLKLNEHITKFKKALEKNKEDLKKYIVFGNAYNLNKNKINTITHNEIAKNIIRGKFKAGGKEIEINFDREYFSKLGKEIDLESGLDLMPKNSIPFAVERVDGFIEWVHFVDQYDGLWKLNVKKQSVVENGSDLVAFIEYFINEKVKGFSKSVSEQNAGKGFMFSTVKVLNQRIPLILFIGWKLGLSEILERYNVNYDFKKTKEIEEGSKLNTVIPFGDGYLHYEYSIPVGLLMNGLYVLNPKDHNFEDFEAKSDAYSTYFIDIQKSNLGKGLNNFYNEFIDPITKEILDELELPTDLADACLYCNTLLASSVTSKKNYMGNYRIRGVETITGMLYKTIGDAVRRYRDSAGLVTSSVPLSVKRDTLIKEMHSSPIMEQSVLMNPHKEARNRIKTTYKGPSGVNMDHPQGSEETREYDESMLGILSPTTPDSAQAGVTRFLSQNPFIKGKRGIIGTDGQDLEKMDASNLLSLSELLSPYSPSHADSPRFGMVQSQSGHAIPTEKMDKPLMGCYAEKAIKYSIGDDFVFVAKQDGVVEDIKEDMVIIKYKDGSKAAIDLGVKTGRVSDGYFLKIQLKTKLEKGKKFKAGDVLAQDPNHFSEDSNSNESDLLIGTLANVAIGSADMTYEDSSLISEELADNLSSKIIFDKPAVISHNSNISNVKGLGDKITTGDPLLVYEEVFDNEGSDVGKMLTKLGNDFGDLIDQYSKNSIPSKYTGEIVDVRIYYNRELEEFSESIQEFIKKYIKKNEKKSKILKECRRDHIVRIPTVEKVNATRIAGKEFDGLLIHYFIETKNEFIPGNKVTAGVALKSIVGSVYEKDKNPYVIRTDSKGNKRKEYIDFLLSPFSTASRMVPDAYLQGYTNKVLIGLKDSISEILDE